MLADPQSVTISGTTTSLPRVPSAVATTGSFRSDDGNLNLSVSQVTTNGGRRRRSSASLKKRKLVSDPLVTGVSLYTDATLSVTFNMPEAGVFTVAEIEAMWTGLKTQFDAATGAVIKKIIGGES